MTTIGTHAFYGCTNLTSIDLPNSTTSIGNSAFAGCTSLNKIAIPDTTTSMGDYTFSGCTSLVEVKLPNCRKNITEGMFKNCSSLTKITLPETVTAIRSNAFNGCSSLTHITIPSGVETIESAAFENCTSLESITIPDGTKTIGSEAFQNCTALTSANLGDGVTSIGSYLFDGCSLLKEVKLGSGLTKIPERAFSNCGALESIMIPYRVEEIGANAFLNDVKLTSVTIPRRTAKIASNAFSYPDKLTIYGVAGTYAETYAGEIGAKFVAIDKPATGVTLNETAVRMNKGATIQLVATVTPVDFTDETAWKSSDTSIATVTDAGVVKAVGIGECTVSFVAGNMKAACKITVVQPVTSISLNKTSLSLDAGETFTLTASVSPNNAENKEITWSSSDETIATVDENGLVTALKKGTATITATANDGSGVQKSCAVTVKGNLYIVSNVADLQSPHPYTVNCNDIWQYSVLGATQLNLTFSADTAVESGSDYIYIYSADGTLVGKYTGIELAGKTITVPGETVRIKLVSDGTYCEYGFAVTNITTQSGTHTHSYSDTVTAPTCTEQGYTTHTCTCGESYVDSYVDALGHAWDNGVVTKQPTQTEKGEKTYTCTRCGATRTESIPELGHKHQYTETVTAPTCTEQGYTTHTCACGDSYVDAYVSPLGHAWDSGKVTTQPTETTAGVKTFTCTRCSKTKTESIPATGGQPDQPDQPCDGGEGCSSGKFVDVSARDWFHEAVDFAVEQGLFGGMSANTFEPDTPMTRAMLVTVLWRYEGEPDAPANTFSDVKSGTWYSNAVSWAAANGVVNGVGNNKFDPEGKITREQMATILFRYAQKKGIDTSKRGNLNAFPDGGKTASWAKDAMQWTVGEGIINGSDGKLLPQGSATRAQVATILMRFIENTI